MGEAARAAPLRAARLPPAPPLATEVEVDVFDSVDDAGAMRRAIALSALGLGRTAPNPTVGCVLVSPSGEVIGEGFHVYDTADHAEVVALKAAGNRARGATAYVTLSPCETTGRTPPCADALREAGVARVVYAVADPLQPPTWGEQGPLADEAARVNEA